MSRHYYHHENRFMDGLFVLQDILKVVGIILLFLVGFVAAVFGMVALVSNLVDRPTCNAQGDKMGIQTEWSLYTGCMINIQGQWLPWSEVVPVLRDGKIVFVPKPQVLINGRNDDSKP